MRELLPAYSKWVEAKNIKEQVREATKSIGQGYHPIDLGTGETKSAQDLEEQLTKAFNTIESGAQESALSENSHLKIEKAKRMIEPMTKTLRFFWINVMLLIDGLGISKFQKEAFLKIILPIQYLKIYAPKSATAQIKNELLKLAEKLEEKLSGNITWQCMSASLQKRLLTLGVQCAHLFQRSSSNVEGRNGALGLHHHVYKQMNARKLSASTVVHNYFIKRQDKTTAAERFFGHSHDDLFEWLVDVIDAPAFSRKRGYSVQKNTEAA